MRKMRLWVKWTVIGLVAVGAMGLLAGRAARSPGSPAQAVSELSAAWSAPVERGSAIEVFPYNRRVVDVEALGDSVWVATTGGLVQLDRKTAEFVRLLTTLDGFPPGPHSDLLGADGQLWMAGEAGLVCFDPGSTQFRTLDPHPVARLEHDAERGALWAFGSGRATRGPASAQPPSATSPPCRPHPNQRAASRAPQP